MKWKSCEYSPHVADAVLTVYHMLQTQIVSTKRCGTVLLTVIFNTWPPLIRPIIGLLDLVTFNLQSRMFSSFAAM